MRLRECSVHRLDCGQDAPGDIAGRIADVVGADQKQHVAWRLLLPVIGLEPPQQVLGAVLAEAGVQHRHAQRLLQPGLAPALHDRIAECDGIKALRRKPALQFLLLRHPGVRTRGWRRRRHRGRRRRTRSGGRHGRQAQRGHDEDQHMSYQLHLMPLYFAEACSCR